MDLILGLVYTGFWSCLDSFTISPWCVRNTKLMSLIETRWESFYSICLYYTFQNILKFPKVTFTCGKFSHDFHSIAYVFCKTQQVYDITEILLKVGLNNTTLTYLRSNLNLPDVNGPWLERGKQDLLLFLSWTVYEVLSWC